MSGFNLMAAFRNIAGTAAPAATPPVVTQAAAVVENNTPKAPETPLDPFANLWEVPVPKDGESNEPQPLFNHTIEGLMDAAKKQNFNIAPSESQLAAINKGGAEAFQAMQEIMNATAQKVFAHSADATTKLITSAVDRSKFVKESDVDKHIKKSKVSETLKGDNPLFSNPAVAPLIKAMESQILLKHPDATSDQIAQMARDYVGGIVGVFTAPERAKQEQELKKGEVDWSTFVP